MGATVTRSLDTDWFRESEVQPRNNPTIGWWADYPLFILPHLNLYGENVPIWDCDEYGGSITEEELSDGRHLVTVNIFVKGAPTLVKQQGCFRTIFIGEISYLYQQKFIVDLNIWPYFLIPWLDDDGFEDDTGLVILPTYYIPLASSLGTFGVDFGLEFVSVLFVGIGEGEMIYHWKQLKPGDSARMVFGVYGTLEEGYSWIREPIYDIAPYGDVWSLDFLKLY